MVTAGLLVCLIAGLSAGQESLNPETILDNQPVLLIERTVDPPEGLLVSSTEHDGIMYILYLYVWGSSDTPGLFELLGYKDHAWDYEPVIVLLDSQNRAYFGCSFDAGHYRAGWTEGRELHVASSAHYFQVPSDSASCLPEFRMPEGGIEYLSDSVFRSIEDSLAALPGVPFGMPLSLDWAVNEPWKVVETGYFSTGSGRNRVPFQVYFLCFFLLLIPGVALGCRLDGISGAGMKALLVFAIPASCAAVFAGVFSSVPEYAVAVSLSVSAFVLMVFLAVRRIRRIRIIYIPSILFVMSVAASMLCNSF